MISAAGAKVTLSLGGGGKGGGEVGEGVEEAWVGGLDEEAGQGGCWGEGNRL